MAQLQMKQNNYKKALTILNQMEKHLPKGEDLDVENAMNLGLASAYQKQGNFKLSNEYVERSLAISRRPSQLVNLYAIQAENFEKIGNFESAFRSQRNYSIAKDSLRSNSDRELEASILAQYSVEKAEKEVELTNMAKEVSDLNAAKQKRMKLFGFLLLGISLLSIAIIVSRHRKYIAARDEKRRIEREASEAIIDNSRKVLASQSELILNKNRLLEERKHRKPILVLRLVSLDCSAYKK